MSRCILSVLVFVALLAPAVAQKPALATVSGTVFCADTNTPARLASVVLRPVAVAKADNGSHAPVAQELRSVQTQLDGSFTIPQVAAGTYYVMASMPGYISPLGKIGVQPGALLNPNDDLRKALRDEVPTVTVQGNTGASITVSLERGASVSGTVSFDDGSPATGVAVRLLTHKKTEWVPIETGTGNDIGSSIVTDDRGAYRISGLPASGESLVEIDLTNGTITKWVQKNSMAMYSGTFYTMHFYSGSTPRSKEAHPFALKLGEDRPGEDISIPLSRLHKLQGSVSARSDGHLVSEANISLEFADDHSSIGNTRLEKDGTFSFAFVPEGDYIVDVDGASDVRYEEKLNPPGSVPPTETVPHVLHAYGAAQVPVHIDGDRSDLNLAVPERSAVPPK